jgi:poly(A) polymerase
MKNSYDQSKVKILLEKSFAPLSFAQKVYTALVENSANTFFVGGMIRDAILSIEVTDVDIATALTPKEVRNILSKHNIKYDDSHVQFGIIIAQQGSTYVEIATFRKEVYGATRYPKVTYITKPHTDSLRRDFTINALYFSQKSAKILDFHGGLADMQNKTIRFIGDPKKRIQEDPLRIIRAIRFAIMLPGFKIDVAGQRSIKKYFSLLTTISESRKKSEIAKIKSVKNRSALEKIINNGILDKKIFFAL